MTLDPVLDCSVGSEKRIDLASVWCFYFCEFIHSSFTMAVFLPSMILPMIVPHDRSVLPSFSLSDDGVAIAAVPQIG